MAMASCRSCAPSGMVPRMISSRNLSATAEVSDWRGIADSGVVTKFIGAVVGFSSTWFPADADDRRSRAKGPCYTGMIGRAAVYRNHLYVDTAIVQGLTARPRSRCAWNHFRLSP